jgi:hypothetical protein
VSPVIDYALVVGYAFLLGGIAVQYRRGRLRSPRFQLLLGMGLTWLAYGFLPLSGGSSVPIAEPLRFVTDVLALVCLVAGLTVIYWWWRDDGKTTVD